MPQLTVKRLSFDESGGPVPYGWLRFTAKSTEVPGVEWIVKLPTDVYRRHPGLVFDLITSIIDGANA